MTDSAWVILDDVAGDAADKLRRLLELVNDLLVMLRQRSARAAIRRRGWRLPTLSIWWHRRCAC